MISIAYSCLERGEHIITVNGHAEYAPPGQDIVCAGVSALVYAAAAALEQRAVHFIFQDDESGLTLHARASEENADFVDGVFSTASAGFDLIAEQYPDYVTF